MREYKGEIKMEKVIFDYTKHRELWEYMAQEETIKNIVNKANEVIISIAESISRTKRKFIEDNYNRRITCSCFACDTHDKIASISCDDCPICIGDCTDNSGDGFYIAYENCIDAYREAERYGDEEDKNTYLDYAQEYALKIAYAKLNKESIEKFDIEVK